MARPTAEVWAAPPDAPAAEPSRPKPAGSAASAAKGGQPAVAAVDPADDEPDDEEPAMVVAAGLDKGTRRCVDAFQQAQLERRVGHLLASREQLRMCAQASCPAVIVEKCVPWLTEVERAIPSIVIAAQDAAGRDVADVRVSIGDKVVATKLDGRPILLDPGMRTLRFQRSGAFSITKKLLIVQGERSRRVAISFVALPASETAASQVSPLAIAGLTIMGAGLLVGAITGGVVLKRAPEVAERCPDGECLGDTDDYDFYLEARNIAHVSTVGFSVAGVGAVVSIVGFALPTSSDDDEEELSAQLRVVFGTSSIALAGVF